jgi:ATP-binding cassette subfamily F protein 3
MVPMIRTLLGGFLFEGDDVYKKVAVLSGGERNRLALARMLLRPSNVLLLDEPTNHLDLDSKEVLLDALAEYAGTLVFVSHDRYFVDRLAEKVIEVGGGEAPLYPGGYEDFLYWKKQREAGEGAPTPLAATPVSRRHEEDGVASGTLPLAEARPTSAPSPSPPVSHSPARPDPPPSAAAGKKRGKAARRKASRSNGRPAAAEGTDPLAPRLRKPGAPPERQALERELKRMRKRLSELESRVAEAEEAVKTAEVEMASPGFYDDRERASEAAERHQKLMWETGDLMSQWEALQAEVDERARRLAEITPSPAARRAR